MNIHRTLTQKLLDANRENAQKSTGPKSETGKKASSANSVKHGLLADGLVFEAEEQERQFAEFMDQLMGDIMPDGALQSMLVEEIAVCWWRLQTALRWEMEAVRARMDSSRDVVQGLVAEDLSHKSKLDFLKDQEATLGSRGWECTELLVRKGHTAESSSGSNIAKRDVKSGEQVCIQLEAKLATSLDTSRRYSTMIRKDLHRAIDQLERLRALDRK
jgi:hypothetical protein